MLNTNLDGLYIRIQKKSMLDDTLLDVLRMEQLRSLQFTDCLHMDTFSVTLCKALQHNGANLENKKGIIIIGSLILGCLNTHTKWVPKPAIGNRHSPSSCPFLFQFMTVHSQLTHGQNSSIFGIPNLTQTLTLKISGSHGGSFKMRHPTWQDTIHWTYQR